MTIDTIDPAQPDPNDPAGQGDDQLRALKQVIQDTFPQVPVSTPADPWDIVLAVGPRALNDVINKATNADLTALDVRVGVNELAIADHEGRITTNEAAIATFDTPANILDAAWPVGSIFISADGGTPTAKGIPGSWAAVGDGRFLIGSASGHGGTGGSSSVSLTAENLPVHKHTFPLPSKNGDIPGTWVSDGKGEYAQNPVRFLLSSRVGEDANETRWSATNTSDGADYTPAPLNGDAVTLPEPLNLIVRFFERTA